MALHHPRDQRLHVPGLIQFDGIHPLHQLSFECHGDGPINEGVPLYVLVTLKKTGTGTRVFLSMQLTSSAPNLGVTLPVLLRENSRHLLARLAKAVENVNDEKVAFGGEAVLRVAHDLSVPRRLVWDALTDPQKLALWWGQPGSATARGDVRPGSSCTLITREPDGGETAARLVFESVEPVEFLTFAHYGHDDREGQPQLHVRIDLNDIIQCGTRVTYTLHSDGIGQGDRSYFVGLGNAEEALARLASMLAADRHH